MLNDVLLQPEPNVCGIVIVLNTPLQTKVTIHLGVVSGECV